MFNKVKDVISPAEVKKELPLTAKQTAQKAAFDSAVKNIISGADARKLIIIGPCSADNEDSVCDYVSRLASLQEKAKDVLFLVPRIYTNKPRTRGDGYKGMLHNPDPTKGTDIQEGIIHIRRMHLRATSESGLFAADEMLYPENHTYLDDLLSYVTIGARSSENQQHRLVASGVDVPIGIKNPMNGSFTVLLNSIYASQIESEFKYQNMQVRTDGNPYAHAVLRGSVDVHGNNIPNYHYEDVIRFSKMYSAEGLKNPAVIIDTNHSNSGKSYIEQIRIAEEIAYNVKKYGDFSKLVKGLLIESYIVDGNQPAGGTVYGKSITDACLGWEKTEKLIFKLADTLA